MISIKQFAVRHLTEDQTIADKIGIFCDDNQILAFINGYLKAVVFDMEKFISAVGSKNRRNIKLNEVTILPNRYSVKINYTYDVKHYVDPDTNNWSYSKTEKYSEEVYVGDNSTITVAISEFDEYGIIPQFA